MKILSLDHSLKSWGLVTFDQQKDKYKGKKTETFSAQIQRMILETFVFVTFDWSDEKT